LELRKSAPGVWGRGGGRVRGGGKKKRKKRTKICLKRGTDVVGNPGYKRVIRGARHTFHCGE